MLTAENVLHKYNPLVPFKNESMHAMYFFLIFFFSSPLCVQYGIVGVKIESGAYGSASIGRVIGHLVRQVLAESLVICLRPVYTYII